MDLPVLARVGGGLVILCILLVVHIPIVVHLKLCLVDLLLQDYGDCFFVFFIWDCTISIVCLFPADFLACWVVLLLLVVIFEIVL